MYRYILSTVYKSTIEISTNLVNKIRNSLNSTNVSKRVGQYTVTIKSLEFWGAYTGTIIVSGRKGTYQGVINSGAKKTAQIMTSYINELSDMAKDLYKQALKSIVSELMSVTGISEYTRKGWERFFKSKVSELQKSGYGKVPEIIARMCDDYEAFKSILNCKEADELKEVFQNLEKVYKKLNNSEKYSDDSVSDKVVALALNKVNQMKQKLADALYDYIYKGGNSYKSPEKQLNNGKKIVIQCPVEAAVYQNGNLLGSTEAGEDSFSEGIIAVISGDVKNLYIPDALGNVEIRLTATANGLMDYMVEQIQDGKRTGRLNYYDVSLMEGVGYTQSLNASPLTDNTNSYPLVASDGEKKYSDEYLSASVLSPPVKVSCSSDIGGTVLGEAVYSKGSPVELSAYVTEDGYDFAGWYVDDNLMEVQSVFRFAARKDVTVRARFVKKRDLEEDTSYTVILGENYEECASAKLFGTETSKDIRMCLGGIGTGAADYSKVTVNKYATDGTRKSSDNIETEYDSLLGFWLSGIDFTDCEKVEILDKAGSCILTFDKKGGEGENVNHTAKFGDYSVYFDDHEEGDFYYKKDDTEKILLLTSYGGSSTDVVIPAKAMVGEEVYTINIGSNLFHNKASVEKVTFETVNGEKIQPTTMYGMFDGCRNLVVVDFSGVDTGNVTNMSEMFSACNHLVEINVSGWDTGNVTSMSGMFTCCSRLAEIDVSDWDTGNVKSMCQMFFGCDSLTSLNLSNWDTKNVVTLRNMFYSCENLREVSVSGWNVRNVDCMWSMFEGCSNLTEVNASNWDIGSVQMDQMFKGCSSLTEIEMSGWDTENVTGMSDMFHGCSSLAEINVSCWDTENVTDMSDMFHGCSSLAEINVSGWDTGNVTGMWSMFSFCDNLTRVDVSGWDTGNVTGMSGMFYRCNSLTEIDVSAWDTRNVTNMESMFDGCSSLAEIDVSAWDTRNVTNMGSMFNGCSRLAEIDVSGWDTENVTDMWSMFYGCSRLAEIDVSGWDTGNVTNMHWMFTCCSSLIGINVGEWNTGKVNSSWYYSFVGGCDKLDWFVTPTVNARMVLPGTFYDVEGNTYTYIDASTPAATKLWRHYSISYTLGYGWDTILENPSWFCSETESFTLKNPTDPYGEYTFTGWTWKEYIGDDYEDIDDVSDIPVLNVTIPKGTMTNLHFTAHWKENDDETATEKPWPSSTPKASMTPQQSPATSKAPSPSREPVVTLKPSEAPIVSKKPSEKPTITDKPDVTAGPRPTDKSDVTASPRPIDKWDATVNPKPTQTPKTTVTPKPIQVSNATVSPKPTNTSDSVESPLVGEVLKDAASGMSYKVLMQGNSVAFCAVYNKAITKIVIPNTVTIDGINYQV